MTVISWVYHLHLSRDGTVRFPLTAEVVELPALVQKYVEEIDRSLSQTLLYRCVIWE